MTFVFPFPSYSHRIIHIPIFPITSIPIPTHSHFHSRQRLHIDYLKAEKYVYYVVNSKQNMKLQKHRYQTHHLSVIIIITIIVYHCSLFNVYQTVTACYCGNFIFYL